MINGEFINQSVELIRRVSILGNLSLIKIDSHLDTKGNNLLL